MKTQSRWIGVAIAANVAFSTAAQARPRDRKSTFEAGSLPSKQTKLKHTINNGSKSNPEIVPLHAYDGLSLHLSPIGEIIVGFEQTGTTSATERKLSLGTLPVWDRAVLLVKSALENKKISMERLLQALGTAEKRMLTLGEEREIYELLGLSAPKATPATGSSTMTSLRPTIVSRDKFITPKLPQRTIVSEPKPTDIDTMMGILQTRKDPNANYAYYLPAGIDATTYEKIMDRYQVLKADKTPQPLVQLAQEFPEYRDLLHTVEENAQFLSEQYLASQKGKNLLK